MGFGLCMVWVAVAVCGAATATAAGLMEPKAEYSADQYMGDGSRTVKSRVYHAPGKSRMEIEEEGTQAIITRFDRKLMWTVMIAEKMYMEMPLGEEKKTRDVRQCDVTTMKEVGKETVNGISTTVSEVDATCPDKSGVSGKVWTSREGILVKMDAVSKGTGKEKGQRVLLELKNLKIGKQDPKLFELPAGFTKLSVPTGAGAPGGFNIKDMMKEPTAETKGKEQPRDTGRSYTAQPRDTGPSYTAQPRAQEKGVLDKALDTKKKIKGLIGW